MTEPRIIQIGECEIRIWEDAQVLETRFEDGLKVPAAPNYDEQSLATAAALGYGSDTWMLSKQHEISHSLLMISLGYPYSRVLRGVAVRAAGGSKEDVVSQVNSIWEEDLVLQFQCYVQTGVISNSLADYRDTFGLDLDALKVRLREMSDG